MLAAFAGRTGKESTNIDVLVVIPTPASHLRGTSLTALGRWVRDAVKVQIGVWTVHLETSSLSIAK